MQIKEETLCTFIQKGTRLQLVKLTKEVAFTPYYKDKKGNLKGGRTYKLTYQVRLNRKIVSTSLSEYTERKIFATYCQNIVLQLKIY